jgi:phenylalanyl-tRNA synthetase alpha chain
MKLGEYNLLNIESDLEAQLSKVQTNSDLELLERDWLSKSGLIKNLFKFLKDVTDEERPSIAQKLNSIRQRLEGYLETKKQDFKRQELSKALSEEYQDLSLPSNFVGHGAVHPITQVERKIASILRPFGFRCVEGPEIETDYYCFDALNIPPHHPARDMQDTFYTDNNRVLRTHTTSVQARILELCSKEANGGLPIKIASFGRAYRNETEDASHQAMFHQFELVWLDEGLTLSNLMALMQHILKEIYGRRRKVRFVPKFYPYTEPSLGPQIDCAICKGSGCASCGGSGWVTVGGSGMIHRKVLEEFKYDPSKVSGFAFGLGTSRLASQMYNIPKLKMIYDNDLRLLRGIA